MKEHSLSDLVCPVLTAGIRCHAQLSLYDASVPVMRAKDNPSEVLEGIVRCQSCGEEYPVICGVLILVNGVKTYLTQNYSDIMSTGVPDVSRYMVTHLEKSGYNLHNTGYRSSLWTNALGMNLYICAHYDNLASIVESSHPLAELIHNYCQCDFYAQMLKLAAPALRRDCRFIDIGCNVGGMTHRLAGLCKFVYGIDLSFRAVLTARRILLGRPEPLSSYRLYHEGLSFEERTLSVEQRQNVEILVADGLNLPFADGVFDFLNCANVVDVVGQPPDLLKESLRVLNSGGSLLLTDPYFWGPERTPIESWFGIGTGKATATALREQLKQTCDVVGEKDKVLWLLRVYDRYFTLWLNDCILARKR